MPAIVNVAIRIQAARAPDAVQAAVRAWLAERGPGPAAVLHEAGLAVPPLAAGVEAVPLLSGCPCCSGGPVLRAALVRVARRLQPSSLLVLLAQEEHADRLRRQVESGELGAGLRLL
jgi:hypothetical protein